MKRLIAVTCLLLACGTQQDSAAERQFRIGIQRFLTSEPGARFCSSMAWLDDAFIEDVIDVHGGHATDVSDRRAVAIVREECLTIY